MAIFARVELQQAIWPHDYVDMQERLKAIGFHPYLVNSENKTIDLPAGCYCSYDETNEVNGANAIRKVANSTGFKNKVVCVSFNNWWGYFTDF